MKNSGKETHISSQNCPALADIAASERAAAADFAASVLRADARVSVYLYQPVPADGLRSSSPGILFDIGPLPAAVGDMERALLYQCAEAGRTGSFLQSAADCTQRVPQTTQIDDDASNSYRAFNADPRAREAQITVEEARHGFTSPRRDGPPVGAYIHHLALSPSVHGFETVASGRLPVLGTIFTVTKERRPTALHEYSNLVDYAIFIAEEALEIRASHLLGASHLGDSLDGDALDALLADPTSDLAVQLVVKLLFAHHWFFPYDAAAHELLRHSLPASADIGALYAAHGWSAPRRLHEHARDWRTLHGVVAGDLATLVRHLAWYRMGKEFRPRPGAVAETIARALNTALLLLVGERTTVAPFRRRGSASAPRTGDVWLGASGPLAAIGPDDAFLAPVFPLAGIHSLLRGEAGLERFSASFDACGPGETYGHTRTHLKPTRFVEGLERGGAPRFSARMQEDVRAKARWQCSYAIARLAIATANSARSAGTSDDGGTP